MMRILQVLLFPLHGSGSGSYADRLAEFEQARGHTVRVLCCDHAVPQRQYETAALVFAPSLRGVPLDRNAEEVESASAQPPCGTKQSSAPDEIASHTTLAMTQPDLDFNFPAFTTHPLSTSTTFGSLNDDQRERYVAAFQRKIREEVAAFKPDIVHAHHGWVIGAALADLDVPYVISLHGTEHYGFTHYPAYRELALRGLRKADRVLALTEVERTTALKTYDLDPDRVRVITSGVDTSFFRPHTHFAQRAAASRTRRERNEVKSKHALLPFTINRPIIFAGSKLTAIKGTDVLLRAAAIYTQIPEHPLTLIVGEGDERPQLEALRDELNLHDDVIFLGSQSAAQMVELYNAADVTVLASRTDWFPLVVIESLACGTPVIASEVGGLSQLVTSNIGRLFSAGDYATLAAHVTDFIRSNFKASVQAACVQHVREKFSWDNTVERIVAVYQEVLAEIDKVTER
jgi:teichuronic acid biosynthesis glycosyltransferase TuaC